MARRGEWNKQPPKDRDGKHRKELKKERRARLKNQEEARKFCFRILPSAAAIAAMMSILFFLYLQDIHLQNQEGLNISRPSVSTSTSSWKWMKHWYEKKMSTLPEDEEQEEEDDDDEWEYCNIGDPGCEEEEDDDDDDRDGCEVDEEFDEEDYLDDNDEEENETACCQYSSCPSAQEDTGFCRSTNSHDQPLENTSKDERVLGATPRSSNKDRGRRKRRSASRNKQLFSHHSPLTSNEDTSFETRSFSADTSGGTEFIVHVERTSAAASDQINRQFIEL